MARCLRKKTALFVVIIFVFVSLLSVFHRPLHGRLQESHRPSHVKVSGKKVRFTTGATPFINSFNHFVIPNYVINSVQIVIHNEQTPESVIQPTSPHTQSLKTHPKYHFNLSKDTAVDESVHKAISDKPSTTNAVHVTTTGRLMQVITESRQAVVIDGFPYKMKKEKLWYLNKVVPQWTNSFWDNPHEYGLDFWDVMNRSYVSSHISRPQIGRYVCKDVLCSEFLNQQDLSRVDKCMHRLKTKGSLLVEEFGPRLLPVCHFIDATSRSSVALISFPGSGNTWVRGLLEKAAGVCTGSIYCDLSIWMSGSVGEGIRSGNVLVVKTHNAEREWAKQNCSDPHSYQAAILLIRNPYDAIVSFYKWHLNQARSRSDKIATLKNPHVVEVGQEEFGTDPSWQAHLAQKQKEWTNTIRNVVLKDRCRRPLLVVHYEDVKLNRTKEICRMLDYLGVSYSSEEVGQRLADDATAFQRHKPTVNFDPYTTEQRNSVRQHVEILIADLKDGNEGNTLGVEQYLHSDP